MKKRIGIISQRRGMSNFYRMLLQRLFGDMADILVFNLEDESIRHLEECDLYLNTSTSYDLMRNRWATEFFPASSKLIHGDITFTRKAVDLLKRYPDGTRALLVNQSQHMAMESIAQLYHLGITNIEFFPYAPEMPSYPQVSVAFAPGEAELAPPGLEVIDIGSRWFTANTICEIALKLGNSFFLETAAFARYVSSLADIDYSLQEITYSRLTAENKLEIILNSLDAGIVCVDEKNLITLINREARTLLGTSRSSALGQPAHKLFPELPFSDATGDTPLLLTIHGQELSVSISKLHIKDRSLGAFAIFHRFEDEENRQITLRLQKTPKSHSARYTFADIVGKSPAICKAKEIALQMAPNNAFVMISGESGTGKELFAQALHSASGRSGGPFIAVNCAALTETLLESELFGYVDGAFTGAKRGGRPGLFECAHRGTLFLDEIETMSPGLQSKLLRVLQEQEVVRIGSVEPIPIDVRVLSSTNEDLLTRVRLGTFRQDLYYRLNVIPIHIPPLRQRREDIPLLFDAFYRQMHAQFTLSSQARARLLQYSWPGNVRELRNCVEYLHYTGRSHISCEDLPAQFQPLHAPSPLSAAPAAGSFSQEDAVLRILGDHYGHSQGLGRHRIVQLCLEQGCPISEHEVRLVLRALQEAGWITRGRGRAGTHLSSQGYERYLALVQNSDPLYSSP